MRRTATLLVITLLLAACVNPKVKKMEADRADVQARLHRYEGLLLAMDSAGIAAMFTPDGAMVNPNQAPVKGRDAIQKFLASFSDYKVLSNADQATSTLIDGDTSEQIGTYRQKVRSPEGRIFEASGRLEIGWVRDASGEWLIAELATFPAK
ncbi:MAG TPA: nuclear transport factor 2 family protein [Opitutaceae bacterium]